jgi:quinol monooxygenase YgiN
MEPAMSVRLIITIDAAPGKGGELGNALHGRCEDVTGEPGCEQFEIFRSLVDPDKLVLLEQWESPEALEVHAKRNESRTPLDRSLVAGASQREDYVFNRTR